MPCLMQVIIFCCLWYVSLCTWVSRILYWQSFLPASSAVPINQIAILERESVRLVSWIIHIIMHIQYSFWNHSPKLTLPVHWKCYMLGSPLVCLYKCSETQWNKQESLTQWNIKRILWFACLLWFWVDTRSFHWYNLLNKQALHLPAGVKCRYIHFEISLYS